MSTPTPTQLLVAAARRRGVKIMTRREWGSMYGPVYAARRRERPHHQIGRGIPTDTLVQHITVTHPSTPTLPASRSMAADMRVVERIGFDRFGSGMSYNFGWNMSNGLIGVGMPLDAKGTHTVNEKHVPGFSYDLNYVSLAIAGIGMAATPGTPDTVPTEQALDSLARLIAALIDCHYLTHEFDYMPHRAFTNKACPGDLIAARMSDVRHAAQRYASQKPDAL